MYPYTQWLLIIIPIKLLFHWGYTPFSDIPNVLVPQELQWLQCQAFATGLNTDCCFPLTPTDLFRVPNPAGELTSLLHLYNTTWPLSSEAKLTTFKFAKNKLYIGLYIGICVYIYIYMAYIWHIWHIWHISTSFNIYVKFSMHRPQLHVDGAAKHSEASERVSSSSPRASRPALSAWRHSILWHQPGIPVNGWEIGQNPQATSSHKDQLQGFWRLLKWIQVIWSQLCTHTVPSSSAWSSWHKDWMEKCGYGFCTNMRY